MDSSGISWNTLGSPSSTQVDFYTIAIHEFGHWLYLYDDYNHPEAIMSAEIKKGQVLTNFTPEDIDAAQTMY